MLGVTQNQVEVLWFTFREKTYDLSSPKYLKDLYINTDDGPLHLYADWNFLGFDLREPILPVVEWFEKSFGCVIDPETLKIYFPFL